MALQIKDLEAIEDLKDDIELWRIYEYNFFEIEKLLSEQQGVSLGNDFGVDFIEMEYPTSIQEQIMRDDWDLANGQTTLAKIMVRNNRDLSLEEAEAIIDGNLASTMIKSEESCSTCEIEEEIDMEEEIDG